MSDHDKYVVVLMSDPSIPGIDHTPASGGGCLLSRPMSLHDARDRAKMCRDAQPSFAGEFLVCKLVEEY